MISFSCAKCGKAYQLRPDFAGRKTTCTGCKAPLMVPGGDATVGFEAPPAETIERPRAKIAFSCEKCGMKFNVPAECAGRKTSCPTCKNPLVVPSAEQTIAYVPSKGQLAGMPSSLAKAGVDVNVSLPGGDPAKQAPLQDLLDGKAALGDRYVVEGEVARGGMGAVLRAVDCDIRREVAVKYLLDQADPRKKARFVEEAQITGQLEHPNIVPIHELGVDAQQRIFFTMKMVRGRSLADILRMLRHGEPGGADYSLGKLLGIVVNICNALAYAHSRGVVHRDLKPANIMVGDFGEVYVMDWGLAKLVETGTPRPIATQAVARATVVGPSNPAAPVPLAAPVPATDPSSQIPSSGKVVTSRDAETDLTQEGSVLGTPVYMPPEQAAGHIQEIDERSDVYSMGAILYEILTLRPPIDRDGGFAATIERVTRGAIEPPEKRAPERARAGRIPPELSAIAMKALAHAREDRYPSIDRFRRDIERFMEGRSVSAKQDTLREAFVKLVKRNRGVSIASATAAVLLGIVIVWSLAAIFRANSRALAEEIAKREQGRRSVPTFVRVAKVMIQDQQFDDAQTHLDAAINFDETDAEARFVRGSLAISNQDYSRAVEDLEVCVKQQPDRAEAKKLLDLARSAKPNDKATLLACAEELGHQKAMTLSARLRVSAEKLMASRKEIAEFYRKTLNQSYPPGITGVIVFENGEIYIEVSTYQGTDLTPLRGMRPDHLALLGCTNVADLAPLKGMPLKSLEIRRCTSVTDLTPLIGMPLTKFYLKESNVTDLSPLRGMAIKEMTLESVAATDLRPLRGMPIEEMRLNSSGSLFDITPLAGMPMTKLNLNQTSVGDLTPLRGMKLKELQALKCPILDLEPLKEMPLEVLQLDGCEQVTDLTPLKGMPLRELSIQRCSVSDLSPLAGMKLTKLNIHDCKEIRSLAPLAGMQLKELVVESSALTDLVGLEQMPLEKLTLKNLEVANLGPLKGLSRLHTLTVQDCPNVKDLTPLKKVPISGLSIKECNLTDGDLQSLKEFSSLKSLSLVSCPNVTKLNFMKDVTINALTLSDLDIDDLGPLAGSSLKILHLGPCPVKDVTPLRNVPLKTLTLNLCPEITNVAPLAGMPLESFGMPPNATEGLDAIRNMKSLKTINNLNPEQYWRERIEPKAKQP